jgi:hypothetical protein
MTSRKFSSSRWCQQLAVNFAADHVAAEKYDFVVDVLDDDRESAIVLARGVVSSPPNLAPKPSMVPPSGRSTSNAALRSASASMPPRYFSTQDAMAHRRRAL